MRIGLDAELAQLRKIGAALLNLFVFRRHSPKSYQAGRPENGAPEVVVEGRLGEAFLRVTERSVERTSALVGVRPDNRVVRRHRAAGVGALVERGEHVDAAAWIRPEVVPLVAARPWTRQRRRRGVSGIFDLNSGVLNV